MIVQVVAGFAVALLALATPAFAQSADALRFGARPDIAHASLSPDGTRVAFLAPGRDRGTLAYVANVEGGVPKLVLASDGDPSRLQSCHWVSNSRLTCNFYMIEDVQGNLLQFTRMMTVNADGTEAKLLTPRAAWHALGVAQTGGAIIDWSGGQDGSILMTRDFVPESATDTRLVAKDEGYGVERIDVGTLRRSIVERPRRDASEYISDGYGNVRILGTRNPGSLGYVSPVTRYYFRRPGSDKWEPLSEVDRTTDRGFDPVAVDRDLNIAYGFDVLDGRRALYKIALDGTGKRDLVFSRPDVDVDGYIAIGRQRRVVGVSFATDRREAVYFDPKLKALASSLARALPNLPLIEFVDASLDGNRLLLWAGSDVDPGRYYVMDQKTKQLSEIMLVRPDLEKVALAPMKAISFPAADGTKIPAYLTLPLSGADKKLPAIVMPHGGPGARDEWGFDWLAQFFAARGYAVLQPNFRGSAGYGEAWFQENGFRSWRTAIGDVNDGGRWLISQGIASPEKLAIVGWSYGGYAALQSAVLDPELFKAIVAIAAVTDLDQLKEAARGFTNYNLVRDFIGEGPHIAEGSPARNAARIKAPVLLFHGDRDVNVRVGQSRLMESRLKAAGRQVEYVESSGLDHYLEESAARIRMLDQSDRFLRTALKLPPAP